MDLFFKLKLKEPRFSPFELPAALVLTRRTQTLKDAVKEAAAPQGVSLVLTDHKVSARQSVSVSSSGSN